MSILDIGVSRLYDVRAGGARVFTISDLRCA